VDRQRCVVNGAAISLVGVVRDTHGPTVATDSAMKIRSPGGAHYPRTIGDLDHNHRRAVEIHDAHGCGHGRLGVVGDKRLQPQGIGPATLVACPGTRRCTVVFHTHEQDAAGSVCQTHDGLDKLTIIQRAAKLPFELDVIALSPGDLGLYSPH
jgi:hypothetical protein